jgi:hypothetical protein
VAKNIPVKEKKKGSRFAAVQLWCSATAVPRKKVRFSREIYSKNFRDYLLHEWVLGVPVPDARTSAHPTISGATACRDILQHP